MCKFSSKSGGGGTLSNFIFLGDLTRNDPNGIADVTNTGVSLVRSYNFIKVIVIL